MQHSFQLVGHKTPKTLRRFIPGLRHSKPRVEEGLKVGPYLEQLDKYIVLPDGELAEPPTSLIINPENWVVRRPSDLENAAADAAGIVNMLDSHASLDRRKDNTPEDLNRKNKGYIALRKTIADSEYRTLLEPNGDYGTQRILSPSKENSLQTYIRTLSRTADNDGSSILYSRTIKLKHKGDELTKNQIFEVRVNSDASTLTVLEEESRAR